MGVNRRDVLTAGGGFTVGLAGGAIAGYFGRSLLSGERDSVPGFLWDDDEFPPFRNAEARSQAPSFDGDESIGRSLHPKESPTVAVIGTLATGVVTELTKQPGARLGIIYTDPGGTWHQGMGRPNQLFGGVVLRDDRLLLGAALGIGRGDVEFSWAVRSGDLTVPLDSLKIDVVPRSELQQRFPGVPAL